MQLVQVMASRDPCYARRAPSNMRMKLAACAGRLMRNGLFLSAAAAGRSFSAIR